MGLLRRLQDTRLYEAAYTDGHDDGFDAGESEGWEAGNDATLQERCS